MYINYYRKHIISAAPQTCENIICGFNADCAQQNGTLSCRCRNGFFGNPFVACQPECVVNPDCPHTKSCIRNKCVDPCSGVCGLNARCSVSNHVPICFCPPDFSGDPFISCYPFTLPKKPTLPQLNPCDPSPCGPYSRCHVSPRGYSTCTCLPLYKGTPPLCQPECIVNSECPQTKACINQKCIDPCPGTCGLNAICSVISHNQVCNCLYGYEGDPFDNCYLIQETPNVPRNPCDPSPCGPNSICQVKQGRPVCSCIVDYTGKPPYCRPECVTNSECPKDRVCSKEKCVDPCVGACGPNANCNVINHRPFCNCVRGFRGDAFVGCLRIDEVPVDPCNPTPCGPNTLCTTVDHLPKCKCIPPYIGNPYVGGCKPECTFDADCPNHEACLGQHCRNPCEGLCGMNTECQVVNHVPVCTCFRGFIGNPYSSCHEEVTKRKYINCIHKF